MEKNITGIEIGTTFRFENDMYRASTDDGQIRLVTENYGADADGRRGELQVRIDDTFVEKESVEISKYMDPTCDDLDDYHSPVRNPSEGLMATAIHELCKALYCYDLTQEI